MISVITDGISQFFAYKLELSILFLTAWFSGIIVNKTGAFEVLKGAIKFTAILCVGLLFLIGASFAIALLSPVSYNLYKTSCYLLPLAVLFTTTRGILNKKLNYWNLANILLASFFLIFLLITSLPFTKHILLPGYADSPIHFQIVQQILDPQSGINSKLSITHILKNYYHFGFHSLAAWLSTTSNLPTSQSISLIGQITLAISPLSIAFFVYSLTKSKEGALSAGALTAFGWLMPAFAVNWGKFPALLALSLAPSLIGFIIYTYTHHRNRTNAIWVLILTLCNVVIHTRILALLILVAAAKYFVDSLKIPNAPLGYIKSVSFSALFFISLLPLSNHIKIYFNNVILDIALVLLLPFAFRYYPKYSLGLFIFMAELWGIESIFTTIHSGNPIFDKQFTDIMLYIPFSVSGGLGIAGALKELQGKIHFLLLFTFFTLICFSSTWQVAKTPDTCCNYYTRSDEIAFDWIKNNTQKEDLFLISSLDDSQNHGTDAGVWIYTLTKRNTNKRTFNTNWELNEGFPNTCNSNLKNIYIYVGGQPYSFSNKKLAAIPWVEKVFEEENTIIFKVIKCAKSSSKEGID